MEQQAQSGNTVRVQYTAKLQDGGVLAASKENGGASFTLGKGQVIAGLEKMVLGMKQGQTKSTAVPPQDAFGVRDKNRIVAVRQKQIPEEIDPKPGVRLSMLHPTGTVETVVITEVNEGKVTLDANHPLAGRKLTLEVTLLEIN